MPIGVIPPLGRWLVFSGIVVGAGMLAWSAARHELAAFWAASSAPELQLRAAEIEPTNAELWHQLGRYRQFDLQNSDLPLAIAYYKRAISINPGSAAYWMDLGDAYEAAGNLSQAEQAFRKARQLYPVSAQAAWRLGNFLLRQGRVPEAFQQIHAAVLADPKLAPLAVSRCWRSTQDIDEILQHVLPDERDDNWGAIEFFVDAREPVPAMAVWRRIAVRREAFPVSQAFPLLDMLIEKGSLADARRVWAQALSAAGIQFKGDSKDSLLWNGGFEDEPLNGGFDWRVAPLDGARMALDEQVVHSGKRSLRVDFDGTSNVEFENIWQYVGVEPSTRYRFSAFFRTEALTTDSGMRFEIRDVSRPGNPPRFTANVAGTQAWVEEQAEFATGPGTTLLQVVLRRTRGEKLANKVGGTVWVDDVALVSVDSPPAAAR